MSNPLEDVVPSVVTHETQQTTQYEDFYTEVCNGENSPRLPANWIENVRPRSLEETMEMYEVWLDDDAA